MSDHGFKLLKDELLSREQKTVIELPLDGSYVIVGGPGSGKTSLAIARAEQASQEQSNVLVLMFNRPLMLYVQAAQPKPDYEAWLKAVMEAGDFFAVPSPTGYTVSTYHSWLSSFYRSRFGYSYPEIDRFEPDWNEVEERLCSLGKVYNQVIIDEGQDFPLPLLRSLRSLAVNITVFIDPMQAMERTRTTVKEAASILGRGSYTYHLSTNYRCTKAIADFSNLFRHSGEIRANLSRPGRKPAIIICGNYDEQLSVMSEIIRKCKGKTVGVIADARSSYRLQEELEEEMGDEVSVQRYQTLTYTEFDFDSPGVKIVTYGTMKGLEFDIVLLPRFTRVSTTGDYVADMNRLHVATSRAKEQLFVFCFNEGAGNPDKWIDTLRPIRDREGYYVVSRVTNR